MTRSALAAALSLVLAAPLAAGADDLQARDARNKQETAKRLDAENRASEPLTSRYNHVLTFGQSLGSAAEGWPALSVEPRYDNLMLGESTRSATFSGPQFKPVGQAAFQPLRAVVQRKSNAAQLLADGEIAQLDAHAQEEGESVEVGALNMARYLYLKRRGQKSDPGHLLLASNAATSGRSIAQLAKRGGTNEYRRAPQAMQEAKNLAHAENASYAVSAIFWLQGEYDYSHTSGGRNDKDYYKAQLRQLRDDLNADARAISGQQQPPAFLSYQTDAKSSVKDGSLAVGMAQWELAEQEPGWYLVGPVYPYPDKGVHLSANGYRWFGQMLGKVYHRVVIEGKGWTPLAPRGATASGREVLVDFLVPRPPLAFDQPYLAHQAREVKNKGFLLHDGKGEVPIEAVELAADTIVRLRAGRELVGEPRVSYASFDVGGAGQLRDSDPQRAESNYEFRPGMQRTEKIPALLGKPYPLHNWSIAFDIPVTREGR
ncbi:phosphate ABC transporter substrate-binding protein [Pseudomonas oligotrophica]|uniref:phosphate ABC transporter substrate-binding protein n=1 Tax=Pseudomonas oligotrophica TaxID=2912055 RepID=UPI001F356A85|nr:phosphate ABC transporter substrate-binding protein [Pseudomonas oligotrophica]MCF7201974.1 phosphate ABC transporter substrate-binding protein [Pseudomonas oligotrophica]